MAAISDKAAGSGRRRGPGRPFQKGASGNPSGRPKSDRTIQMLAQAHTKAAIAALVAALKRPRERVPAAIALLDRGWGRPAQTHDVHHDMRPVSQFTDAELTAIILGAPAAPDDDSGTVH